MLSQDILLMSHVKYSNQWWWKKNYRFFIFNEVLVVHHFLLLKYWNGDFSPVMSITTIYLLLLLLSLFSWSTINCLQIIKWFSINNKWMREKKCQCIVEIRPVRVCSFFVWSIDRFSYFFLIIWLFPSFKSNDSWDNTQHTTKTVNLWTLVRYDNGESKNLENARTKLAFLMNAGSGHGSWHATFKLIFIYQFTTCKFWYIFYTTCSSGSSIFCSLHSRNESLAICWWFVISIYIFAVSSPTSFHQQDQDNEIFQ